MIEEDEAQDQRATQGPSATPAPAAAEVALSLEDQAPAPASDRQPPEPVDELLLDDALEASAAPSSSDTPEFESTRYAMVLPEALEARRARTRAGRTSSEDTAACPPPPEPLSAPIPPTPSAIVRAMRIITVGEPKPAPASEPVQELPPPPPMERMGAVAVPTPPPPFIEPEGFAAPPISALPTAPRLAAVQPQEPIDGSDELNDAIDSLLPSDLPPPPTAYKAETPPAPHASGPVEEPAVPFPSEPVAKTVAASLLGTPSQPLHHDDDTPPSHDDVEARTTGLNVPLVETWRSELPAPDSAADSDQKPEASPDDDDDVYVEPEITPDDEELAADDAPLVEPEEDKLHEHAAIDVPIAVDDLDDQTVAEAEPEPEPDAAVVGELPAAEPPPAPVVQAEATPVAEPTPDAAPVQAPTHELPTPPPPAAAHSVEPDAADEEVPIAEEDIDPEPTSEPRLTATDIESIEAVAEAALAAAKEPLPLMVNVRATLPDAPDALMREADDLREQIRQVEVIEHEEAPDSGPEIEPEEDVDDELDVPIEPDDELSSPPPMVPPASPSRPPPPPPPPALGREPSNPAVVITRPEAPPRITRPEPLREETSGEVPVARAAGTPELEPPKSAPKPPPLRILDEASAAARKRPRLWWEDAFSDDFVRAYRRLTPEQVRREASFIDQSLGIAAGGTLLDLGCGFGQHAVELATRGYKVVGYDLSLTMLALAADEAQARGQKLNFLQGDMREMAFDGLFDGVYSWDTSFGYFEEEKNANIIQRVHRALRPHGIFLLDVANRDFVAPRLPSLAWFEGDGCVCIDDAQFDSFTSRMRVKRTLMLDDGRTRELEYSLRLYSLHEVGKLLNDAGFRVMEVSGHTSMVGAFLGTESPRIIACAERR